MNKTIVEILAADYISWDKRIKACSFLINPEILHPLIKEYGKISLDRQGNVINLQILKMAANIKEEQFFVEMINLLDQHLTESEKVQFIERLVEKLYE